MKKNILSLAVAASAAGMTGLATAQMYVNTEHTGEALIFPFYSAQNGNTSLISIVNTTSDFKAVKVRIIEGTESEETLDFNLYMSPQDHFSFAVSEDGEGAKLVTSDTSCTVPEIKDGEQAFTDLLWVEEDDDGNPLVGTAQGREQAGYIEVIEMGQVIRTDLTEAIIHVDGEPTGCEIIRNAWAVVEDVEGAWYVDANAADVGVDGGENGVGTTGMGLTWNGGGLYGVATVLNVAEGTAFGYDAVAIENLVDDDEGHSGAVLHYAPGDTRPDFADEAISNTATVAINGEQVTYTNPDELGLNLTSYHTVSAVMMTESISNDYVVDADINALTDWIVTMPTKSSYESVTLGWREPFTFSYEGGESGTAFDYPNDCQPFSLTVYDREEGILEPPPIPDPDAVSDTPQFSPYIRPEVEETETPDGVDPVLCSESTIVHFGTASATNTGQTSAANRTLTSVNGLLSDEDQSFDAGWAVMDLSGENLNNPIDNDRLLPGTLSDGGQLVGLPVTGFAVVEYTNGTLGSAIANYQSSWEHKTSVATSSSGN
jgi:hypothetical protein